MEPEKVRFRNFDDSALYFAIWVYVRDYSIPGREQDEDDNVPRIQKI